MAKTMASDIEIARGAKLLPIEQVAAGLGIPADAVYRYGPHKAKLAFDYIKTLAHRPSGKLILVTAISPTPAGEGKTTTTVGLGDALRHIGKNSLICLREPSLGPVFGAKGGAAASPGNACSTATTARCARSSPRWATTASRARTASTSRWPPR